MERNPPLFPCFRKKRLLQKPEGQLVRVVYDPLKGCEGFLLKIKEGKEKLVISVDILQRSVAVEIDGASVEPVTLL